MLELDPLVSDYKIFVDSCSLLHRHAEHFFYNILPDLLKLHKNKIIVPERVRLEVEHLKSEKDPGTSASAGRGALIIHTYREQRLADVRGEDSDPFADNLFIQVFTKFRKRYNLLLITQDRNLAEDILRLKDLKSVSSDKSIRAFRLDNHGQLSEWFLKQKPKQPNFKFKVGDSPIQDSGKCITISSLPGEGDYVESDSCGRINLTRLIGDGGEGRIFETADGKACKIYFPRKLTETKLSKLKLMIENPVPKKEICWPIDIVRNLKGEFCGYLMPKAAGIPMQKAIFHKPLLQKNFPHWTRKHIILLAETILENIQYLHSFNVLIGDINPLNILIASEEEVYFVDTDSYQIESYPCPVGMLNFTAPEIQMKNFQRFLRTLEHENFAVATLLFIILLPGKSPYSQQGGGSPGRNIIKGEFSYPLREVSNKKTPDGPWRFIWSNLPFKTKEAFFECFAKNKRIGVAQWLFVLRHYITTLDYGNVSDEIFPTIFKPPSDHARRKYGTEGKDMVNLTCCDCEQAFSIDADKAKRLLIGGKPTCYSCFNIRKEATVEFTCSNCSEVFSESYENSEKMNGSAEKLCRPCRQLRKRERETGEQIQCIDCRKLFLFSVRDQKFFKVKGFEPPKRCGNCRKERKKRIF